MKKVTRVFEKNAKIAWMKLLKGLGYTVLLAVIAAIINWLTVLELPVKYTIYVAAIMAVLQAIMKALQEYKPQLDK